MESRQGHPRQASNRGEVVETPEAVNSPLVLEMSSMVHRIAVSSVADAGISIQTSVQQ